MKLQMLDRSFSLQKFGAGTQLSGAGFTLLELLIAMAIASIGLLLFSSLIIKSQDSLSEVQLMATRGELDVMLRKSILNQRALKITIDSQPQLHAVVRSDYSTITSVNALIPYGVTIYDSNGTALSGPELPSPSPVYYTTDGMHCTPGQPKCYISITSMVKIQGTPDNDLYDHIEPTRSYPSYLTILKPEFLQFSYTISIDPNKPGMARKDITRSVFITIEDIGVDP